MREGTVLEVTTETEPAGVCVCTSTFILHHPPRRAASLSLSLCPRCGGSAGGVWDLLLSLYETHANRLGCKTPEELTHTA